MKVFLSVLVLGGALAFAASVPRTPAVLYYEAPKIEIVARSTDSGAVLNKVRHALHREGFRAPQCSSCHRDVLDAAFNTTRGQRQAFNSILDVDVDPVEVSGNVRGLSTEPQTE